MVDLPFSLPFYQWLLKEESTFTSQDLRNIDPTIASTVSQLEGTFVLLLQGVSYLNDLFKNAKKHTKQIHFCKDIGLFSRELNIFLISMFNFNKKITGGAA